MDKVTTYRTVIKNILSELAEISNRQPVPGVETICVFDEKHDEYLLMDVGWMDEKRVLTLILFFRIKDGKIWLEENNTDLTFDDEFDEAGIRDEDIVIGFHSPSERRLMGYAIA
jgi:hypothetical protein